MRWVFGWLIFTLLFLCFPKLIFAQSDYVLPYPSSMPGSKLYLFHQVWERVSKYWYFGDFGQFEYNRQLADKYLIEAKTLFEYKQYLFADSALQKSDIFFAMASSALTRAKRNGKIVDENQQVLKSAGEKHREVLLEIQLKTPSEFIWQEEKKAQITLHLSDRIEKSLSIRLSCQ